MKIPTYEESAAAVHDLTATPLQKFIYEETPQFHPNAFQDQLQAAVDYTVAAARSQALQEAAQVCMTEYFHSGYVTPSQSATNGTIEVLVAQIRALAAQPAAGMTLAEVKDKYFPNVTLDQLEGRDKKTPLIVLPKPAAAPACPNCGVTGQVSGPGTATLCMACGAVEL